MKRAYFHTFGCKLNFAETSSVAALMAESGVTRIEEGETPDYVVVNTCSVTEEADKKCRQAIRSFNRRWPQAAILVTGCFAQLKPSDVAALPGVKLVAGNDRKTLIAEYVRKSVVNQPATERDKLPGSDTRPGSGCENHSRPGNESEPGSGCESQLSECQVIASKDIRSFTPSCSRGDRTRCFLKVQDGCDCWCSYCTIPAARGRSRSGSAESIVAQARQAAAEGAKEIVITGVNIGDFGRRTADETGELAGHPRETFLDLIRRLDRVEGIERYRISSIEPDLLTDEIISFCAESQRFMPHFHIPLQSGSDAVLRLMRRRYDTALFRDKILKIKEVMPDAFIGIDLIVGARGETLEEFERSKEFISSLPITRLHIFPYSERPGTRALEIEHVVSQTEKHRRVGEMIALSESKMREFAAPFAGTVRPVLLERGREGDPMSGYTDNYLKVSVMAPAELDNQIVMVRLESPQVSHMGDISFTGSLTAASDGLAAGSAGPALPPQDEK